VQFEELYYFKNSTSSFSGQLHKEKKINTYSLHFQNQAAKRIEALLVSGTSQGLHKPGLHYRPMEPLHSMELAPTHCLMLSANS